MMKKLLFLAILAAALTDVGATFRRPISAFSNGFIPAVVQVSTADIQVSTERIARHVQYLASEKLEGRRTGTAGADQAADYIAKEFRSYKLKPATPSGFLQNFKFVSSVKLGSANSFQINAGGKIQSLEVEIDYMPLAFSSSEPVAGGVIFVGFGIGAPELQYDNYAGKDVTGKIVMLMRGSPDGDNPHSRFADYVAQGMEIQKKTLKAREKGAKGVVFISDEASLSDDRLSRLRHDLNFLDSGIPAVVVSRQIAQSILRTGGTSLGELQNRAKSSPAPTELVGVNIQFKTAVLKLEGKGTNVVGILPGSDPILSSEYIVIGAHYDHLGHGGSESLAQNPTAQIHYGADDNASGTSAMMELARAMAESKAKPKRSLVFIGFSGEEMGLLGSGAYTKDPPVPLKSTVAMLNMDMVGRLRNGSLFISGVGTSPAWKPLLNRLNEASSSQNGSGSRFQLSFGEDGFGPSDHQSFYVRDIPVLFFFTGTHEDYHKPTDRPEKVNSEGIKQIADFVAEVINTVAAEPERIAFTRVKTESRPSGRGFNVYLGTVPNYSDQNEGLKLDGVRAGSPAEKAGLKAGDILSRLGNVPIKNVYDYTYALGEMRAGIEVEVVLKRDGKEMKLKITPEKRR
jgi:Zn-dependent M28 family amino/carboxypeptidase